MKSFFALAALAGLASATPEDLNKRACIADNCLRALTVTDSLLRASRPAMAKADCATFMAYTSTVTVTPVTSTVYETVETATSTTSTELATQTDTSTVIIPTTMTVLEHPAVNKRGADATVPAYASPCSGTVRFSSACSCIGFTATTVTVSATVATPSVTITLTSTSIISIVESTTQTTTTLTTSTSTSTLTLPTCNVKTLHRTSVEGPKTLTQYFVGHGVKEASINPGSAGSAATSRIIPDTGNDCAAIAACADFIMLRWYRGHFDLHYNLGMRQWECVTYAYSSLETRTFNVRDENVGVVYGYSGNQFV